MEREVDFWNRFLMQTRFLLLIGLIGLIASQATGGDVANSESLAAGKKLYLNKCAKCHKMYDPAKYDDHQWDSWMNKMDKKAKLKAREKEAVAEYIRTLRPAAKEPRTASTR